MAVSSTILGMNARNFKYVNKYNKASAKRRADDKVQTKLTLREKGISSPQLFMVFDDRTALKNFDWETLPKEGFVVKPARGYGGGGIIVMKNWNGYEGKTVSGEHFTAWQLRSHVLDILDGSYSLNYLPDAAFIEARIIANPVLRKLSPKGLPDLRIIVFNQIPIMAMLRLPTAQSHGTANLHQGAVGCGVEMRTGITTGGIVNKRRATYIPETKVKLRGIMIPEWDKVLDLAVRTQVAVGLGYAGVDIVLDKRQGPMVLEVNARPGLSIQLANMASLRSRLERVEGITVRDTAHGIDIARSLFAEKKMAAASARPVLGIIEDVTFIKNGETLIVQAKIDTGAKRTSLGEDLVEELGLESLDTQVSVRAASGRQTRDMVKTSFVLAGKKITTEASVADRGHLNYRMIVGRDNLKGFLVDPSKASEDVE